MSNLPSPTQDAGGNSDKLVTKMRQLPALYHERCKQFVTGDGSMVTPYTCQCGEWNFNWHTNEMELK